jgi:anthranilate phosphoribosyltransferase
VPTWAGLLSKLLAGRSLSSPEASWAMSQIMSGEATPVQVAGFTVALRAKGESAEEVAGLAEAMLAHGTPLPVAGPAVDTCGTGGDRAGTVNVSTMAALVARAAGATVVKHGNRAATSKCGSADLLESLGVAIDLPAEGVAHCVRTTGIGFCFAPVFHPALRHAALPRRELGVPTVFNFLGPLTNPGRPTAQAVGVADERMAGVMAEVLARRGVSALLFRGDDGLDELTTTTTSQLWWARGGQVSRHTFDPTRLGIPRADPAALAGGDAQHNARVALEVLDGTPGPVRDAVLLAAAAALTALDAGDASVEDALATGLGRAAAAVDDGAAKRVLQDWVAVSQEARGRSAG